jgi:hypothetical protein
MLTHDEATNVLVDRFLGRADPSAREAIDAHAGTCEECRGALETLTVLAGRGHPSSERIVDLALGAGAGFRAGGDPDLRHLDDCPVCAAEVSACRESVAAARAIGPSDRASRWPGRMPFIPTTLAAALILAILGYPAWLGLVELPKAQRLAEAGARSEALELRDALSHDRATPPTETGGGVGLALYLDVTRGTGARSLALPSGGGVVTLLFEVEALKRAADTDAIRIEVRDRAGHLAWSRETTAGEVRGARGADDALVAVLVPARALEAGSHTLGVKKVTREAAITLLWAPFDVEPVKVAPQRQAP